MKPSNQLSIVAGLCLALPPVAPLHAYGGGGGSSSSCSEPQFSEAVPARNAVIPQVEEVFVVASDNTDPQTVEWDVGTQRVAPKITVRRSGELELRGKLPAPLRQPGKLRIALSAKSKDGCTGFFPYFVEIKP